MRLLVVGGSGFLGGYVLREAARRGHQVVALARSPRGRPRGGGPRRAAARRRPRRRLPSRRGVRRGALRGPGLPRVAGPRSRPGHRRRRRGGRHPAGRLRLDHRGDDDPSPADQAGPAGRRAADPRLRAGLDDPAADDDLRCRRRPQPVPAAAAAEPGASAAGAGHRRTACTSRFTWPTSPPPCWPRWSGPRRSARCTTWPGPSRSRSRNCCTPAPARSAAGPGWCRSRSLRW